MPRGFDNSWQRFAPSKPIAVEGGVSTSKQRGSMAESWWSKRFVDVLDSYGMGGRMQRGRRYARTGQVMSLGMEPGMLMAEVQGSRRTPYAVTVRLAEVTDEQWGSVEQRMREQVGLIAGLLAGEVPEALEGAFDAADVPLFPRRWGDMEAGCSCPDYENPCKHLAAVLYVFADQLDRDPWLLMQWRGRSRDEVMALLHEGGEDAGPEVAPWWPFGPGKVPDGLRLSPNDAPLVVSSGSSVFDRLDDLDLDVRGTDVVDLLSPLYEQLVDGEF